jgi:hypothetical protein
MSEVVGSYGLVFPTATLVRFFSDDRQTLGTLTVVKNENIFVCKTLELAWKGNKPDISCIPEGEYPCIYTRSRRLSELKGRDIFTYEVLNVPGRAGIRIHSANYFFQLKGCITLGSALKDLNLDGSLDIIHSGDTVQRFNLFMECKSFRLIVRNEYN